jgi:hypothetical protein
MLERLARKRRERYAAQNKEKKREAYVRNKDKIKEKYSQNKDKIKGKYNQNKDKIKGKYNQNKDKIKRKYNQNKEKYTQIRNEKRIQKEVNQRAALSKGPAAGYVEREKIRYKQLGRMNLTCPYCNAKLFIEASLIARIFFLFVLAR